MKQHAIPRSQPVSRIVGAGPGLLLAAALAIGNPGPATAAAAAAAAEKPVADVVAIAAPLVDAARDKDAAGVKQLLSARPAANVNQRSSDGTTALHWAVYNNDVAMVERLLKARADVNARNDYDASPLSEAAVVGNVDVVRRLLKAGADVESPNADGQTALMTIARTSNVEVAKLLIASGAKVNASEQWRGQTPLMWAAAEGQPGMVKLLIAAGADVNARSRVNRWERQVTAEPRMQARPSGGFTPLLYAARRGCADCARSLVAAGADVNLTDPEGVGPLLLAILNFSFDTAAVLIDAGADIDKWDTWGRSAVYAVVDVNTLPTGGRADRPSLDDTTALDILQRLLAKGANPNLQLKLFPPYRSLRDDRGADGLLTIGTTPLIRAAKAGDIPAMQLLLKSGARVDLPTASGITPLMAAAGNGSAGLDTRGRYKTEAHAIEAVNLLLAAGAKLDVRDRGGQTALHGAASWGWNGLVETLVAGGVDLGAKDSQGRTAADVAAGSASSSGRGASIPRPETEKLLRRLMAERGVAVTAARAPIAAVTE
jgi:ankyrin repeat protein